MPAMTLFEYRKWLKGFKGKHRDAAMRGLHSAAMRGVQMIQTEIIPASVPQPVDRGIYRAGWRFLAATDGALIFNNEPHAAHIEYGVRSQNVKIGRRMIFALTEWVTRKKLASPGKEAVSAAWAIAQKMKQRGIFGPGLHVLFKLKRVLPAVIREEISAEIEAVKGKK